MEGAYFVHEPTGFRIRVQRGEMGYLIVSCLDLQGCHTQGSTIEEALANIDDAIQTILEVMAEEGLSRECLTINIAAASVEGYIGDRLSEQDMLPFPDEQKAKLIQPGGVSDQTVSPPPRLEWAA